MSAKDNKPPANTSSHLQWPRVMFIVLAVGLTLFILVCVAFKIYRDMSNKPVNPLRGNEISVSDQTISNAARRDAQRVLLATDEAFSLPENQLFRNGFSQINSDKTCSYQISKIDKIQGGFDMGAKIVTYGSVLCGGEKAYTMTLTYTGSALSKEKAADFKNFRHYSTEVTITDPMHLPKFSNNETLYFVTDEARPGFDKANESTVSAQLPRKVTYKTYTENTTDNNFYGCSIVVAPEIKIVISQDFVDKTRNKLHDTPQIRVKCP